MQATLTLEGQILLPHKLWQALGIIPGDSLEVTSEEGRIILSRAPSSGSARIETDAVTGLPVLMAETGTPELSSERVAELLAEYP